MSSIFLLLFEIKLIDFNSLHFAADSGQSGVAANISATTMPPPNTIMAAAPTSSSASTPQAYYVSQQQQQQPQQPPAQQAPVVPPPPTVNYQQPATAIQPSNTTSAGYYYQQAPAPPPPSQPAPQPPPPATMATYSPWVPTSTASYYADYTSPPPTMAPVVHMVNHGTPMGPGTGVPTQVTGAPTVGSEYLEMTGGSNPHAGSHALPSAANAGPIPVHSVMSPSLTSGFSGSGDCKSTETSSILSAASYSSGAINGNSNHHHHTNYNHNYEALGGGHGSANFYSNKRGYNPGPNNNYYPSAASSLEGSAAGHNHHHYSHHYNVQQAAIHNGHGGLHHGLGRSHYHHPSRSSSSYTSTSNTAGGSSNSSASSAASSKSSNNNSNCNNIHLNNNKSVFCETCQIPFPSVAVLDNHLKGSRHARRVKSQQAFRQLKESGTLFRIRGSSAPVSDLGPMSSGAIRCEVCQVSVNSSHQLQAHLTGNSNIVLYVVKHTARAHGT